MNRRGFLGRLAGAAVAAVMTSVIDIVALIPERLRETPRPTKDTVCSLYEAALASWRSDSVEEIVFRENPMLWALTGGKSLPPHDDLVRILESSL